MLPFSTLLANCCVICSNSMLDANMTPPQNSNFNVFKVHYLPTKVNFTQFNVNYNSIKVSNVTGNDSGWNLDYLQLAGDLRKTP